MDALLCGDVGGTHSRLALYARGWLDEPLLLRVYPSAHYPALQPLLEQFLAEARQALPEARPVRACFGAPGPTNGAIIRPVNLAWVIDTAEVARWLALQRTEFINDFSANCLAVTRLGPEHLQQIGKGERQARQPLAVLGAGTGLGEGFVVWHGEQPVVVPTEGGHKDFAPHDALEMRLLAYLLRKGPHVSWELLLSGMGLVHLYEFLRDEEALPESPQVRAAMAQEDPAAVITRYGVPGLDGLCSRVLDLFCTLYGAEAGNLALQVLATGGVYLAGGIARHLGARLHDGKFRAGFENKGRYRQFVETIPTYLITHPWPGLLGAAIAADRD
ncbi:MAG TPA: glucokinase, partial [bacterium]|nr:glucokinase [bacterium]